MAGGAGLPGSGEVVAPVGLVTPDGGITNGDITNGGKAAPPGPARDAGSSDAGLAALDRCDVGRFDPRNPPRALTLGGNLGAHDPVIIAAEGQYHFFSTGNGISVKTSPDLLRWTQGPDVFATTPAW